MRNRLLQINGEEIIDASADVTSNFLLGITIGRQGIHSTGESNFNDFLLRFLELKDYVLKQRDELSPKKDGMLTASELMGETVGGKKGFGA